MSRGIRSSGVQGEVYGNCEIPGYIDGRTVVNLAALDSWQSNDEERERYYRL